MNEVTKSPGYDSRGVSRWAPAEGHARGDSDAAVVALALLVAVVVWRRDPVTSAALATVVAGGALVIARSWLLVVVMLALVVGASVRTDAAWASLEPDRLGAYTGWVRLIDDPAPLAASTRVIVEIEGERFEMWIRGRAAQRRVATWQGGDWVAVGGERRVLAEDRRQRVAWQHVVGRFEHDWLGDTAPGGPLARASNSVRSTIERGASAIPAPDDALFRGLVIGDDRDQPFEMIGRFRASGLSHLTAVSGQNVAFVLAACTPLLVRLRPWARWAITVALIAWFVALTRFEPSILRAGVMAGLSATAFVRGVERRPVRLLAIGLIGLLLVDPLLAWSIGFWLSVGATAGVCTLGPWLAARLTVLGPLAIPVGVSLGAQVGVVLPSVLVFGRLPLVSIPANLLAVPVAGLVMLYGLPAAIIAGMVPALAAPLMLPARLGTRWVDIVAGLGARLEPGRTRVVVGLGGRHRRRDRPRAPRSSVGNLTFAESCTLRRLHRVNLRRVTCRATAEPPLSDCPLWWHRESASSSSPRSPPPHHRPCRRSGSRCRARR